MRFPALFLSSALLLAAGNPSPAHRLWQELSAKRVGLASLHQEFEVTQNTLLPSGNRASKWKLVVDLAGDRWREKTVTGSGSRIRLFDGRDLVRTEEGEDEYIRLKRKPNEDSPLPIPYDSAELDWPRATELKRAPCKISPTAEHTCVYLRAPLKTAPRTSSTFMLQGVRVLCVDLDTGIVLSSQTTQSMQRGRTPYILEVNRFATSLAAGAPPDPALFQLPSNPSLHEVKTLSVWNASRIRSQLTGNPAPDLSIVDLNGNPVNLAALKGKLVLLDFWATWCPPCRADAPALDKLYQSYGKKDLEIVGISVSEDRAVVEKYLIDHPHPFPIALTTENEMPRQFQIGVFPTYVVIDRDGKVAGAAQGDQGFGDLRKLLRKAGLPVD